MKNHVSWFIVENFHEKYINIINLELIFYITISGKLPIIQCNLNFGRYNYQPQREVDPAKNFSPTSKKNCFSFKSKMEWRGSRGETASCVYFNYFPFSASICLRIKLYMLRLLSNSIIAHPWDLWVVRPIKYRFFLWKLYCSSMSRNKTWSGFVLYKKN